MGEKSKQPKGESRLTGPEHPAGTASRRAHKLGPWSLVGWMLCVSGCVVNPVPTPGGGVNGGAQDAAFLNDANAGSDVGGIWDTGAGAADAGGSYDASASDTWSFNDIGWSDASGADAVASDAGLPSDATQTGDAVVMSGDATSTDAMDGDALPGDVGTDDATDGDALADDSDDSDDGM